MGGSVVIVIVIPGKKKKENALGSEQDAYSKNAENKNVHQLLPTFAF